LFRSSGLSMTGSNADVRIAIKPSEEGAVLISLFNAITGQSLSGGVTNKKAQTAITLAAKELTTNRGNALVVAGSNDVNVQLLANAINSALGAYGAIIDLDNFSKQYQGADADFQQFLASAGAGQVGVAFFLNANPLYDYIKSDDVTKALAKVDFTLSFSDRADETASTLKAIAPTASFLESWGDSSSKERYYTVIEPTIKPVFNTRQAEQSLLIWAGDNTNVYEFVKHNWESNILAGTGKSWNDVLQTGFVYKGTSSGSSYTANVDVNAVATAVVSASKALAGDVELKLYEPTGLRDGRYAN